MLSKEPPSPLRHQVSRIARRIRVITKTALHRSYRAKLVASLGVAILVPTGVFAAMKMQPKTQETAVSEKVSFILGNYVQLDTLASAESEGSFSPVAISGQNVGGSESDSAPTTRQHVVVQGETLSTIAAEYNLHSGSIVLANKDIDNTELIHVGQVLTIPDADASDADLAAEKASRQQQIAKAVSTQKAATNSKIAASVATTIKPSLSLVSPIGYKYISQGFGPSHPGLDLVADIGTPVRAVKDSCLILAATGWNGGYGNTILLDLGGGYTARYGHLSRFAGYSSGDCVKAGTIIGYSGSTGNSTGPHLHFEVRKNGTPLNPGNFGI